MEPRVPTSEMPSRVGSYELVRLVGEGSMGRVYEARHVKLDRTVAIKLLRPEQAHNADLVERFFQEARTVNRINHPHIVQIQDFVEERDAEGRQLAYCVMEFVEGVTLAELISNEPVTLERALRIIDQVCKAVDAAHALGVVHRDLKPENVLVTRSPDGIEIAKVLDFGVAKLLRPDPEIKPRNTFEGAIVGTPRYMAPEQAASLEVDFRTDVYGVGCILYELLTGRAPFEAEAFGSLVAQILTQPPEAVPTLTRAGEPIPAALQSLCMQCLEKDPALRPQTIEALRTELWRAATEKPARPRRWRAAAALVPFAATVIAALALGLDGSTTSDAALQVPDPVPAPQIARLELEAPSDSAQIATGAMQQGSESVTVPAATQKATAQIRPRAKGRANGAARRSSRDAVLDPFAD